MEEMLDETTTSDNQGEITKMMVSQIRATAPWMKFVSIFSMVLVVLYILMLFYGVSINGLGIPQLTLFLISGLQLALLIYLFKAGNGYTKYSNSKRIGDFEIALKYQRIFWIVTAITLVLVTILIISLALYINSEIESTFRQVR